jgi:cell fate regulator YaaT (PSP1 superfamily)
MIAATVNTPVVELSFKGRRRELYLNPDRLEYRTGEHLIVQADRGEDIGVVVLSSHPLTRGGVPAHYGGEGAPANGGPTAAGVPHEANDPEAAPSPVEGEAGEPAPHDVDAPPVVASAEAPGAPQKPHGPPRLTDGASRGKPEPSLKTMRRILRRATMDEIAKIADLRVKEDDASRTARKKILDHKLDMKLVDVEYQFDGNRITFYFTAEQRVDFRDLVKDLASAFRTRIELRQIGVRDESGRLGGVGVCGRPLCCTTWIREFAPITLKMAKEQNLSLSPSKLSGVCGRLKCCLRYELEFYQKAQKTYPRLGAQLVWNSVTCDVVKVDIFREGVWVFDPEREMHWIALADMPEIAREDRLSFKKKKSSGGQGGCGNVNAGGCGAGRGEARAGGGCGTSGGGCGSGGGASAGSGGGGGCGGCGTRPRHPGADSRGRGDRGDRGPGGRPEAPRPGRPETPRGAGPGGRPDRGSGGRPDHGGSPGGRPGGEARANPRSGDSASGGGRPGAPPPSGGPASEPRPPGQFSTGRPPRRRPQPSRPVPRPENKD